MKKLIAVLAAFMTFISFSSVFAAGQPAEKNILNILYSLKKNSVDVAVIGPSSVYRYVMAPGLYEKYGYSCFNVSIAAQPGKMTKFMIYDVLKNQNPQLIVVELRWFANTPNDYELTEIRYERLKKSLDMMSNSINRLCAVEYNIPSYFNFAEKAVLRYRLMKWDGKTEKEPYDNKLAGAAPSGKISSLEDFKGNASVAKTTEITDFQKKMIDDIIYLCQANGKEILFTFSPYKNTETDQIYQNSLAEYVESLGYKCLDANRRIKQMELDFNTDFYNGHHVNISGAEKYTELLGEFIDKNYDLKPGKKNKRYWDDCLAAWETKRQEVWKNYYKA